MSEHDEDDLRPPPECDVDFWGECLLVRIMTDPPRYELRLPDGRKIGRLRTADFFSPAAFTVAYVDVVGAFPPLPQDKTAGPFLLDVFRRLLEDRKDVEMVNEASDYGTICGDIKLAIAACPRSDDPRDLDRGALYQADGDVWLNARCLLARVQRACPVKMTPADFYSALVAIGLESLGARRHCGWQGRVWLVPTELLPATSAPLAGPKPMPALPPNGTEH